jgi:hypothetical protein
MPLARWSAVAALTPLLLWSGAARAGAIALRPVRALYVDAKEGPLKRPEGVACTTDADGASVVVVADTGNRRTVRYKIAKDATMGAAVESKLDQLTSPVRVQLDAKGNALVLDGKTRRLVRVGPGGEFRGYLDVKGEGASELRVGSFKVGAEDSVVILDFASPRVLVTDSGGTVTRQVALPKASLFTDVAVDGAGNLYAIEAKEAALWVAEPSAKEFKRLTKAMKQYMSFPTYIAVDRALLLVVDQNGAGIVQVGIDGSYQGRALAFGTNEGLVAYPSQVCTTSAGETFVADRANNRVQLFVRPE